MKHEMHLQDTPFAEIKRGEKTIEIRLNDEKRKRIKPSDEICFHRQDGEKLTVRVVNVLPFPSFARLFSSPLREKCGMCGLTAEECISAMSQYYSAEDEKKYGVLAIEICLTE